MSNNIPPSISGFPEWSPAQLLFEKRCLDILERNFNSFGYIPLRTSNVELTSTLISNGSDDKEIYTLSRLGGDANDDKKYALHFDLTVPLARYIAQRERTLTFPFKRYQIQSSYRGETPAKGRYREFIQADIDVISKSTLPLEYDAEVLRIVDKAFKELDLGKYKIKISNRKILFGLLESYNLNEDEIKNIIRHIDKKDKLSSDKFEATLAELLNSNQDLINKILTLINTEVNYKNLNNLKDTKLNETYNKGIDELYNVISTAVAYGLDINGISIDLSLARGLAYYTGTILETKLIDYPDLGSVCGGGRYENLVANYLGTAMPGVGVSFGITRALGYLFENNLIDLEKNIESTGALIANMNNEYMPEYIAVGNELRTIMRTENYLLEKKISDQLTYAINKNYKYIIIIGNEEMATQEATVKNLVTRDQKKIKLTDLAHTLEMKLI